MAARFSWSRNRQTGLHASPETHTLRRGGVAFAVAQHSPRGWFAYGIGDGPRFNTCGAPTSLKAAKADALARVRADLASDGAPSNET